METQSVDPREAFVKEITDESDVSNCTSSDYEKLRMRFLLPQAKWTNTLNNVKHFERLALLSWQSA